MSSTRPEYLVRTTEVPFESLRHLVHPMDNTNQRYTVSLGDSVGLTKLGIHFCRLPPGRDLQHAALPHQRRGVLLHYRRGW